MPIIRDPGKRLLAQNSRCFRMICRKCYARLPKRAKHCRQCHSNDVRPKKIC